MPQIQKQNNGFIKEIERLLDEQTIAILSAVDEKLKDSETRVNQKIDRLITTIDGFLKRPYGHGIGCIYYP